MPKISQERPETQKQSWFHESGMSGLTAMLVWFGGWMGGISSTWKTPEETKPVPIERKEEIPVQESPTLAALPKEIVNNTEVPVEQVPESTTWRDIEAAKIAARELAAKNPVAPTP